MKPARQGKVTGAWADKQMRADAPRLPMQDGGKGVNRQGKQESSKSRRRCLVYAVKVYRFPQVVAVAAALLSPFLRGCRGGCVALSLLFLAVLFFG